MRVAVRPQSEKGVDGFNPRIEIVSQRMLSHHSTPRSKGFQTATKAKGTSVMATINLRPTTFQRRWRNNKFEEVAEGKSELVLHSNEGMSRR